MEKSANPQLPVVLDIEICHTSDRERKDKYRHEARELKRGWFVDISPFTGGKIMVESLSDDMVTIEFNNEKRTLRLGDVWTDGPFRIYNPIDSSDNGYVTVSYHRLTFWEYMIWLMDRILNVHEKSLHPIILSTVDDEEKVLGLLNFEIETGNVGLYPLKAFLSACKNWHTGKILRKGQFESILLEGIEKGALAPDDVEGWDWLKIASDTNDPSEFMSDMERYYDLLASAAEAGNTDALDIMNEIWPPEQIIEED